MADGENKKPPAKEYIDKNLREHIDKHLKKRGPILYDLGQGPSGPSLKEEYFERVIMIEMCTRSNEPGISILGIDFDYSEQGAIGRKLAEIVAQGLIDLEVSLCELETTENQVVSLMRANNLVVEESAKLVSYIEGGEVGKFYKPVESSFDMRFKGPTKIIIRSTVPGLVFDPRQPLIFNSGHDSVYYRQDWLSDDYLTQSYVNAYCASSNFFGLPSTEPKNQVHKIDYGMLLCKKNPKFGQPDNNPKKIPEWLITPIRIDPAHVDDG